MTAVEVRRAYLALRLALGLVIVYAAGVLYVTLRGSAWGSSQPT